MKAYVKFIRPILLFAIVHGNEVNTYSELEAPVHGKWDEHQNIISRVIGLANYGQLNQRHSQLSRVWVSLEVTTSR